MVEKQKMVVATNTKNKYGKHAHIQQQTLDDNSTRKKHGNNQTPESRTAYSPEQTTVYTATEIIKRAFQTIY